MQVECVSWRTGFLCALDLVIEAGRRKSFSSGPKNRPKNRQLDISNNTWGEPQISDSFFSSPSSIRTGFVGRKSTPTWNESCNPTPPREVNFATKFHLLQAKTAAFATRLRQKRFSYAPWWMSCRLIDRKNVPRAGVGEEEKFPRWIFPSTPTEKGLQTPAHQMSFHKDSTRGSISRIALTFSERGKFSQKQGIPGIREGKLMQISTLNS